MLGISGIEYQFDENFNPIRASFGIPEPISFGGDGLIVTFGFGREGPTIGRAIFEISIKQFAYLEIEVARPRPIEEMLQLQRQVVDLISFGVGIPLVTSSIDCKYAVPSTATNGQWAELWIERQTMDEDIPIPERMTFTFQEIRDKFGDMLLAGRILWQP